MDSLGALYAEAGSDEEASDEESEESEESEGSRCSSPANAQLGLKVGSKVRTIATMPRFWSYVRRANLVDALAVVKPLANLIGALQRELPAYQVAVKGATIDHTETKDNHAFTDGVLHWWRVNGNKFPAWAQAARIILAFTCNSARAERVFSMLKAMFGDQQSESMADYIQTAIMLRANKRPVG